MRIPAALLTAALIPAPPAGQTPPPPAPRQAAQMETVSVTGEGRATLAPDRVSFTAGVETTDPALGPALEENNRRLAGLIAALKKQGVAGKEIRTSQVSISPQMDYQQGKRPRIVGYQVTNLVTVTRDDPADAGKLLQAALDAGANHVSGLSFTVADPTRGRDAALASAVADARAKAEVLARAAGRALGRALSITEGSAPPGPPIPFRAEAMQARGADVPVEPGTEELRFTVSVVFELR